jgi:ATP adenylyltransferase
MTDDDCSRTTAESELPHHPVMHQRLWTPWRMRYVGGGAKEAGCLFCRRLAETTDTRSLIVYRATTAFVILNLFPYNTGHVMIVPNEHVATPETARWESLEGMAQLLPPALRALRRVLSCDGFNVGFNIGDVAGAGVAEHLHQHVVPRWKGDANFMPILASTMVMPELIPVTYAKVRAELTRELAQNDATAGSAILAILSWDGTHVAVERRNGRAAMPRATAEPGEALWKAAIRVATSHGIDAEIAGWAGAERADGSGISAFALRAANLAPLSPALVPIPCDQAELSDPADVAALHRARDLVRSPESAAPALPGNANSGTE